MTSSGESYTEPPLIVGLRQSLRQAFEKDKANRDPCATIVGEPGQIAKLGIRPKVLAEDEMGRRVYSLTMGQVRKVLARYDYDAHKEGPLAS